MEGNKSATLYLLIQLFDDVALVSDARLPENCFRYCGKPSANARDRHFGSEGTVSIY
jgi:hypothetical protein